MPEIEFLNAAVLQAGLAVTLVLQVLKLKIIPVAIANRYPVVVNILLSIIAAIFVIPSNEWHFHHWWEIVTQVGVIAVIAALTYNQLLARWTELRELEGKGK